MKKQITSTQHSQLDLLCNGTCKDLMNEVDNVIKKINNELVFNIQLNHRTNDITNANHDTGLEHRVTLQC